MTNLIRDAVSDHIKAHGMTRAEAAAAAGLPRAYLTDLLNARKGDLPRSWGKVLDALGLELVVRRKGRGSR